MICIFNRNNCLNAFLHAVAFAGFSVFICFADGDGGAAAANSCLCIHNIVCYYYHGV